MSSPGSAWRTGGASVEISADLPPELVTVTWLRGTWEGLGVGNSAEGEYQFGQRIVFECDGRAFLSYDSRVWRLDDSGNPTGPDARESGFWRPARDGSVEAVITSASGVAEIYLGQVDGARIELATDVVTRTSSAEPYSAGRRLYGHVEGDLLYAHDAALGDDGLSPLRSARLARTDGSLLPPEQPS